MSTANTVYDQLRAAIVDGTFPSGEPLRQEQIARDFGVSKIPIREALIQLEADGFVEMFSGRGAFVARLSAVEAEEIYLMRIALEPVLLAHAIPRAGAADWFRAGGILAALQAGDRLSFQQWHALDSEFHAALYSHANLPAMKKLVANLHDNLARYYRVYETFGADFRAEGEAEHAMILAACQAQDVPRATNTLIAHLTRSSGRLLTALAAHPGSDNAS